VLGRSSGRFVRQRARVGPRPWPRSASSSLRGASSWRLGHPVVARGSLQRANWRWSRPPRLAHRARTPGRPVHAKLGHATCRVRLDSAHFAACRAAPPCAPISHHLARPSCVSPSSCSKLTPTSRSVPRKNLSTARRLFWKPRAMNGYLSDRVQVTLLYRPFQSPANRSLRVPTVSPVSSRRTPPNSLVGRSRAPAC